MDFSTVRQPHNSLLNRLKKTRNKENILLLLSGFMQFVSVCAVAIFLTTLVEFVAAGDIPFRTFLFISQNVVAVVSLIFFVVPFLLRFLGIKNKQTINEVALRVGNHYPNVKDKLANALQLLSGINLGSSPTLIESEFNKVFLETKDLNFEVIYEKKKLSRSAIFLISSLAISIGLITTISGMDEAFNRVSNFSTSFLPPAPFSLKLETKKITKLYGEKAEIIITADGEAPDFINLNIKEINQEKFDVFRLRKDQHNTYKYEIASTKHNLEFFGEAE